MRQIVLVVFVCIFASGCTTTVPLRSPMDANHKVQESSAVLMLRSGVALEAEHLMFGEDTTRFTDPRSDSQLSVCSRDVASVRVTHHGGGAMEGMMLGGLGGAAFGLVAGTGMGSGGDARMGKGFLLMGSITLGGFCGAVFGGALGHDYLFIMPPDTAAAIGREPNALNPNH